ncbi:endonuclease/exonuclease/phosphatase family protein [Arenibacter sp. F20364]|uniref:endonuclease/exonuclease/phosphatase family protein n=1 Tax=Arenibacter sp. F20364 TaxID=2926415 RepID=UPI001FF18B46|nr:endonuclease/exonuclease/phosphatase family protein [Arenibacter sp. F20364]MCK0190261.1 endonuclease/exonuclease/phosphatase family protein [Arenibacter sp. F20364]
MKHRLKKCTQNILLIFLLFPLLMVSQETKGDFGIITYNIWNGYDWGKDQERREKVRNWISTQTPDVVALQELCAYTPEKLQEDATAWGHPYSVLLKTTGYSVGFTSKYPIELKERIVEGMHHGALHCKTNGIDFLVIHLHPGSIGRRREETNILSRKLEAIIETSSKYVVLGDFNDHSPFDADLYDPNGYLLKRLRESNAEKGLKGNIINGNFDYAVMSKFLSIPLYDVVQKFSAGISERGSFPGRVLAKINKESEEKLASRLERIDYIMVSPDLNKKCLQAKVHNAAGNWYLSDHYPVSARFELKD